MRCGGETTPKPSWVMGESELSGFYVGVGQAEPGDAQLERARAAALAHLGEGVEVWVASRYAQEIRISEEGAETTRSHALNVKSSLTLAQVSDAGIWKDPGTCTLWARLKARRDVVNGWHTFNKAKALYKGCEEKKATTPAQKLAWLDEALALLGDERADEMSARIHLRDQIEALRQRLLAEAPPLLVLLNADPELAEAMMPAFQAYAENRGGRVIYGFFGEAKDSLAKAREELARHCLWVDAKGAVTAETLGMYEGKLSCRLSWLDVKTGAERRVSKTVQGYAFDRDGVGWEEMAGRLLSECQDEEGAL